MRLALPTTLVTTLVTTAAAALALVGPLGGSSARGADSAAHTRRVVVRPVTASGRPAAGWAVERQRGVTVSCGGTSAAAVSNDIVECFPTAEYLPACWRSANHTVLCLRNARVHRLVRVRYTGSIAAASAPARPSPLDLLLPRRQMCSMRIGGAWAILPTHPHWSGFYSCRHGSVYGPPSGDGINRSGQPWTVELWRSGTAHRLVVRPVRTAYYVGTHH